MDPESWLRDGLHLRWPDGIPVKEYNRVIELMFTLGELVRGAPKRQRMRAAPEPEQQATRRKGSGRQALRERLERGSITIEEATDIGGYSASTTTYATLKTIGAKQVISASGDKLWTLRGPDKRSDTARHGGHGVAPIQNNIRAEVTKAFKPGVMVNLGELRRKLGCTKSPILQLAKELGAQRVGWGPHARWILSTSAKINGSRALTNGAAGAEAPHA